MADNRTAFHPAVFDPHVFQIFGGQPVGPRGRPEFYTVVRKRPRPTPLQRPVWDKPPPPEPVIPLPPAWMLHPDPQPTTLPDDFMLPVPQIDFRAHHEAIAAATDADDTQDVLDAVTLIAEILPALIAHAAGV